MADGGANTIETLLRVLGAGLSQGKEWGGSPWGAGLTALSETMAARRKQEEQGKLAETLFGMLPEDMQQRLGDQGIDAPGMAQVLSKIVPAQLKPPSVNVPISGELFTPESLTGLARSGLGGGMLEGAVFRDKPQRQTASLEKLKIQETEKQAGQLKDKLVQIENNVATQVDQTFKMGMISREQLMEVLNLMERAKRQVESGDMTPQEYVKFLDGVQSKFSEIPSIPKPTPEPPPQSGIRKIIPDFVEKYIPGL